MKTLAKIERAKRSRKDRRSGIAEREVKGQDARGLKKENKNEDKNLKKKLRRGGKAKIWEEGEEVNRRRERNKNGLMVIK